MFFCPQAIAIAGCFLNEGSILVVCPAVLRFTWAEELERWLPCCLPADIHLGNALCFELNWIRLYLVHLSLLNGGGRASNLCILFFFFSFILNKYNVLFLTCEKSV